MPWFSGPYPNRPAPFWLLVAVTASGTMAMHILVPVLPLAARDLDVSAGAIQLSITLYLFGIAGGQLIYGPISDRVGRRPTLLASLVLYLVGSIVAGLASNLPMLLAARVVQAIGGCGGLVLGRAVVRDSAEAAEAASRMALLTMVQSMSPGIAPALGGFLGAWFGWRSPFLLLVLFGGVTLAAALVRLPETAASRGAPSASMLRSYGRLLRSRTFCGYMVGGACNSTSIYGYLSASPFIFTHVLGQPAERVGLYYLVVMGGVPVGSFVASRLARAGKLMGTMRVTSVVGLAGALLFLGLTVTGHLTVASLLVAMLIYSVGVGATSPLALAGAVSSHPQMIGAASGLYGFAQMGFGALCTLVVSLFAGNPALTSAVILVSASLLGQVSFGLAARGRPVAE